MPQKRQESPCYLRKGTGFAAAVDVITLRHEMHAIDVTERRVPNTEGYRARRASLRNDEMFVEI